MSAAEKPAWREIVELFARHGLTPPPTRLRDELVDHLLSHRELRKRRETGAFGPG